MNSHVNDPNPDDSTNFGLDDDFVVCKVSAEWLRLLETWLQEQGLPPVQKLETPSGEILLAHDAAILDRFDRSHLSEAERASHLPEKEKIPIVYCFPKTEP
jgi:hypothetical protein